MDQELAPGSFSHASAVAIRFFCAGQVVVPQLASFYYLALEGNSKLRLVLQKEHFNHLL